MFPAGCWKSRCPRSLPRVENLRGRATEKTEVCGREARESRRPRDGARPGPEVLARAEVGRNRCADWCENRSGARIGKYHLKSPESGMDRSCATKPRQTALLVLVLQGSQWQQVRLSRARRVSLGAADRVARVTGGNERQEKPGAVTVLRGSNTSSAQLIPGGREWGRLLPRCSCELVECELRVHSTPASVRACGGWPGRRWDGEISQEAADGGG